MRLSHLMPKMGLAAFLLSASCSDGQTASGKDDKNDQLMTCPSKGNCDIPDQNGPNPHWTFFDSNSRFYINHPREWPNDAKYEITGFVPVPIGSSSEHIVRGYFVQLAGQGMTKPSYTNVDGQVQLITSDGIWHRITGMQAQPAVTDLTITYCKDPTPACTTQTKISGDKLLTVTLDLAIPIPDDTKKSHFSLTFTDGWVSPSLPLATDKWTADVTKGIMMRWAIKGGVAKALCVGDKGTEQLIVPQDDVLWHPSTFRREQNAPAGSVSIGCETGAIAECVGWGYSPAYKKVALLGTGGEADMMAMRDTCIQMKTANYCGDGSTHTKPGTNIMISDPLDPSRRRAFELGEAIWDVGGAKCINSSNLRHPEYAIACATTPTECDPADFPKFSDYNLISSLPK